ncbi:hypothetical protein ACEQ8H_004671 [Pleosporales sp. CAS-2024a]
MANDDDTSQRNRERPEDNPFIAFRRFADSQVSSLLHAVFTLPATIANYSNIHQAREACLFQKADKTQCNKLQALEDEIAGLRHQARELYRAGHLQQVVQKSEELMQLHGHADALRKEIVAQSDGDEVSKELVHRVANKKGQEWAWDWSWGFPKPFDDDREASHSAPADRHRQHAMAYFHQLDAETKRLFGDDIWDKAVSTAWDVLDSHPMLRSLVADKLCAEDQELRQNASLYSLQALESDSRLQQAGINWREAYADLLRTQLEEERARSRELSRATRSPGRLDEVPEDDPSYEYAHDHEDQHDDPPTPRELQRESFGAHGWPADGTNVREERRLSLGEQSEYGLRPWCIHVPDQDASEKRDTAQFLSEQQRDKGQFLVMSEAKASGEVWCDPLESQKATERRDVGQFLSEQQQTGHDRELRDSVGKTETELDAYEHLLGKPRSVTLQVPGSRNMRSSILSTLTTTERTVAPDGSVTTKVVLKKRFADGREESSETVHTQRGHESDPWDKMKETTVSKSVEKEKEKSKSGWFWSS